MLRALSILGLAVFLAVEGCNAMAGGGGGLYGGGGGAGGGGMGEEGGELACVDTYESFAQGFFATYCTRCHSSTLSGDDRNGAPEDLNWDDLDIVRQKLARIRDRAVELQTMPPPALSTSDQLPGDEERERLGDWIDCGALTDADVS